MSDNIIDISGKITNQLPMIRITEDKVYSVNNRKNTILNMQAMIQEAEKKAKEKGEFDEMAVMNKAMEMLLGVKNAREIDDMDLPFPEYKLVYQGVMAAATGTSVEEVEKRFQ